MPKRPAKPPIIWTLNRVLATKKLTAYGLTKLVKGISPNTVYRAARAGASAERAEGKTLRALCEALNCQPGDLLEWRRR